MNSKTLTTDDGFTIEVKLQDDGTPLVRHTDKNELQFGEFVTISELADKPGAWEFMAKKGIYTNSESGIEALKTMGNVGFLIIDGEQILIGPQDGELISAAIAELQKDTP